MTKYQFTVTVPASGGSNRIRLSAAAITAGAVVAGNSALYSTTYLPACRISAQLLRGSTGVGFVGDASVDQTGANGALELASPGTAGQPGGQVVIESQHDRNVEDLSQFYAHGTVPGDVIGIVYWQA